MKQLGLLCFLSMACLSGLAATDLPSDSKSLLLDEKTVVELTAGLSQYENLPRLAGKLASGGSGVVTLLINRWASEFATLYPEVVLDIQGGGSVASMPAFLQGKVDLMPMARPLWPSEVKSFRDKFGCDPAQIVVAQDAVGIYVNKNNPLTGLTLVQLDGIYSRDAQRGGKRAEFWGDLGVSGPLAEARIIRIALSRVHGTHEFFRDQVMLGSDYRFGGQVEALCSSLVQAVGADDAAVGFGSVMFGTARTRFVPLQTTNGDYLLPSYENTANGRYPLARQMRIVLHRKPDGSMNPVAREFLRFAVSRRGQRIIALAESYPLTVEQQQEALRVIGEPPAEKSGGAK
ncbi:MAG TPA: substrate-binding domain-containing protein [Candidatus Saccharimonadales bacterium]|nr:substrate-binding domain-containing protein [Candidatus Saccharimonadales bacterium]